MIAVRDLFEAEYGVNLEYNRMQEDPEGIPFISRRDRDNGVQGRVKRIPSVSPLPPNTLSVAVGGSVMASFLQEEPYYSGYHIYWLRPKKNLPKIILLYYCMILRKNAYRFSYGRQANRTFHDILIPSPEEISKLHPWAHTKEIRYPAKASANSQLAPSIKIGQWRDFPLDAIFSIKGSKTTPKGALGETRPGGYPYVTTQTQNNGVEGNYLSYTESGGCICIDSAVVGWATYQEKNFSASDHVEVLRPKNMERPLSPFAGLFVCTVLNREIYKYNYGRKRSIGRLAKETIRLPATSEGKPDWAFMEEYMKSLPFSSNLST